LKNYSEAKYRRAVVTLFAIEAGKLLGYLTAHYMLLLEDGLDVEPLARALENLRSQIPTDPDKLI
jgi:hypothetical protein